MLLPVFAASCAAVAADCRRYIYDFCASSTCFATLWCRCTLSTRNEVLPAIGSRQWISAANNLEHAWPRAKCHAAQLPATLSVFMRRTLPRATVKTLYAALLPPGHRGLITCNAPMHGRSRAN